jgi:hypothetical protein
MKQAGDETTPRENPHPRNLVHRLSTAKIWGSSGPAHVIAL